VLNQPTHQQVATSGSSRHFPVAAAGSQDGGVAAEFGLEQRVDRFGLVVAVADGADRRLGVELVDSLRVGDRCVLGPASLWQISPARSVPRRVQAAMFNASTTSEACMVRAAFQPTIRLEQMSTMNAT